ncbi:MAG: sterol carrier family protein [Candidatus Nanopelagicaceae bacterium]
MSKRDQKVMQEVKQTLAQLVSLAPGRAIEVRIPPYAAVQCGAGPSHSRGTPPNVIEMDANTWLALASGKITWSAALESGAISASGARADLSEYLPIRIGQ